VEGSDPCGLQCRSLGDEQCCERDLFGAALKKLRKLGSFAFVRFAIVIWVGVKACFAFFQDAILHSLQEWLLSRNLRYQSLEATSNYRVVTKREEITASRPEKGGNV